MCNSERLFSKLDVQLCADCVLIVKALIEAEVLGQYFHLDSLDVQICVDCILIVKILLEYGFLNEVVNFDLDSLDYVYNFLSGRSLEYDFCRFKSLKYGN